MPERQNLGDILMKAGRVTREDVSRAVEYQRVNGGYFGEALVALGSLSREELEWSLASQFDIPYVFPDADSVDPEAVSLVTPEWALAHLALPIMRTEDTLTVVVDSPLKTRAIEELQARTNLEIQLALASAWKIRELVRQLYARRAVKEEPARAAPVELEAALGSAMEAGSRVFGISTRGSRAWFWYDESGTVQRVPLETSWREGLDRAATPPPTELLGSRAEGTVQTALAWQGYGHPVELRYLCARAGEELVFRPLPEVEERDERFPAPPQSLLSEVRLLARSGSARFLVSADPPQLAREILPYLPELLLEPSWRSVHVAPTGQPVPDDVLAVVAPTAPREWRDEVERLRSFHFDAVTVDGAGAGPDWPLAALDAASAAFLLVDPEADPRAAHAAGVRWTLRVGRGIGRTLDWMLDPLHP